MCKIVASIIKMHKNRANSKKTNMQNKQGQILRIHLESK